MRSHVPIPTFLEKSGSFPTWSNDWILHELSGDGAEEFIRNAWTIWLILQLLHFSKEFITQAHGPCRRTHEWENMPGKKTGPSRPHVLPWTQKQSAHRVEQAQLAHALIHRNNQSCFSGIWHFSFSDGKRERGWSRSCLLSVLSIYEFVSKQALKLILILKRNLIVCRNIFLRFFFPRGTILTLIYNFFFFFCFSVFLATGI